MRGEGVTMMIEQRATVIKGARVEQVHEAHEVAVTGRHDRREEALNGLGEEVIAGIASESPIPPCDRFPRVAA